jgi:hypothetical protein
MSRISSGLASVPANLSVVYTTDNPGITPNGTLTIADGDAATVTRAEYNELAEECEAKINAILDYLRAVADDAV